MNFNTRQFTQVIEKALALSSDKPRWQKAVERAAEGLRSGNIVVSEMVAGALVTTENGSYHVNGAICECPAYRYGKQPCKHRCAVRLQQIYTLAVLESQIENDKRIETRTIEEDWRGNRHIVVRYDSWQI